MGVLLFWSFGQAERKTSERDAQKRGKKVWEVTKTNSVFNQHKWCLSSRAGSFESITRCREDKGTEEGAKYVRWNKRKAESLRNRVLPLDYGNQHLNYEYFKAFVSIQ